MIDYRALFRDLLGEPADARSAPAETEDAPVIEADDMAPAGADGQAAETRPLAAADDVVSQRLNGSSAGNLAK